MTPSQQAKSAGLNSLAEITKKINVSNQTLNNWAKNKPALFEAVIAGVVALKKQ